MYRHPPRDSRPHSLTVAVALFLLALMPGILLAQTEEREKPASNSPGYERILFDSKVERTWDFLGKQGGFADFPFAAGYELQDITFVERDGYVAIQYMEGRMNDGSPIQYQRIRDDDRPLDTLDEWKGLEVGYQCNGRREFIRLDELQLAETSGGNIAVALLRGTTRDGAAVSIEPDSSAPLCITTNYTASCTNVGGACAAPARCRVEGVVTPNGPRFSCTCTAGADTCILVVTFTCEDNGCAAVGGECVGRSIFGDNQPHPASPALPEDGCICTKLSDAEGSGDG